jgi:hypothetical protein
MLDTSTTIEGNTTLNGMARMPNRMLLMFTAMYLLVVITTLLTRVNATAILQKIKGLPIIVIPEPKIAIMFMINTRLQIMHTPIHMHNVTVHMTLCTQTATFVLILTMVLVITIVTRDMLHTQMITLVAIVLIHIQPFLYLGNIIIMNKRSDTVCTDKGTPMAILRMTSLPLTLVWQLCFRCTSTRRSACSRPGDTLKTGSSLVDKGLNQLHRSRQS